MQVLHCLLKIALGKIGYKIGTESINIPVVFIFVIVVFPDPGTTISGIKFCLSLYSLPE